MLTPKVGDTVIIKGIVRNDDIGTQSVAIEVGPVRPRLIYVHYDAIDEIVWEPKVGDEVIWDNSKMYPTSGRAYTLILIHTDKDESTSPRKWGVVAYKGDSPHSIPFNLLKKP